MKDSLWSYDLFRCESATLRTHWVLVVIDQFTRRMVGFGVEGGIVDGPARCRMFNRAIRGQTTPKYLSTDNDPFDSISGRQLATRRVSVRLVMVMEDLVGGR
jgi:putative transposase